MFEFFDALKLFFEQYYTYIFGISIVSILVIYLILKYIFKSLKSLRLVIISISIYVAIALLGSMIYCVNENSYMFSFEENKHLYGKVYLVKNNGIELNLTKSTSEEFESGKVNVLVNDKTIYAIYSNSVERKCSIEEMLPGSNVEIICKLSNDNELVALKVIKTVY